MPSRHHVSLVARKLKGQLNGKAFLTIPRVDVTEMLREISGEDTTRIKSAIGADLDRALLEQGVRCYPTFTATTTGDTIRLFHAGSVLGSLVDLLIYPSTETDHDLAAMLTKIKGKWNWSTPTGPAALIDSVLPETGAAN
jgi:hypothetical protein